MGRKAKVIKTGEIIEVECLYSVTYSRLDCNGKIYEEYDEDELEFIKEPIKGETLGAHLRNLLSPYKNLLQIINDVKEGKMDRGYIWSNSDSEALDKLIEFSKCEQMESVVYKK